MVENSARGQWRMERVPDLVSVVVSNYNNANYLKECLDSLARQKYEDVEIIVVDDASMDNSVDVIRAWKRKNRRKLKWRMLVVELPRNVGYSGALNVGLYLAKGEFIAIQDSDDLSHRNRLDKQVKYLREHTDIDMVGTCYASFRTGNFAQKEAAVWLEYGVDKVRSRYAQGSHCVCHGTILFRGKVFDKLGGPTRRLHGSEDYDFIENCISHGVLVDNLTRVLYYYRRHSKQRSAKFYGKKRGEK
jgi:glycosyltransferase involved in cell wall biosynthesis